MFSNAFYATTRRAREGRNTGFVPTLKVTTRDAEEAVEIRVRDNGTGIPVDIRDKLFQPFFTTKPTGEGTGLGLSITYDIVTQQHGGSITVDSHVGEYMSSCSPAAQSVSAYERMTSFHPFQSLSGPTSTAGSGRQPPVVPGRTGC